MKHYAIIKNGRVDNIAIAEGAWPFDDVAIEIQPGQCDIGWSYDGSFVEPEKPVKPRNIAAEIAALEQTTLMPRATREFMLTYMEIEAAKANLSIEQLKAVNSGYKKVKELDDQIKALRGLL